MEQIIQPYIDMGIPIYTKVVIGIPFIEVIRAVQRNYYDLVMKVAQHDTSLTASLFGSTDMHQLRKCPCPVWIEHLQNEPTYHRILAAVTPLDDEYTDLQQLIMDLATSMAEHEHATLNVVHAWDMPGESILANGRGRISRHELDLLLEMKEQRHRRALDSLLSTYNMDSQADHVHLIKGKAGQAISNAAIEGSVDLIVMGCPWQGRYTRLVYWQYSRRGSAVNKDSGVNSQADGFYHADPVIEVI